MLFVASGSVPCTADYDAAEIGNLFFCDLKGGDEVFVAFEAGGLAEIALGCVHVADHAD